MRKPLDDWLIAQVDADFDAIMKNSDVASNDGIISMERYAKANPRILWVLKQNIDFGVYDYSEHVFANLDGIYSSPTWRRIAHASHGMLLGIRDFGAIKAAERSDCTESFLSSAIVNANKETGESSSSDDCILGGYAKFRSTVAKQLAAYDPDVVIVSMTGTNERLKPIVESVFIDLTGATEYSIDDHSAPASTSVAWSRANGRVFLWTYHPSYLGVTDRDFFDGVVNAYDACLARS